MFEFKTTDIGKMNTSPLLTNFTYARQRILTPHPCIGYYECAIVNIQRNSGALAKTVFDHASEHIRRVHYMFECPSSQSVVHAAYGLLTGKKHFCGAILLRSADRVFDSLPQAFRTKYGSRKAYGFRGYWCEVHIYGLARKEAAMYTSSLVSNLGCNNDEALELAIQQLAANKIVKQTL